MVMISAYGAAISAAPGLTLDGNASFLNLIDNNQTGSTNAVDAASNGITIGNVSVTAPGSTWTLTGGTGTAAGNYDIFIVQTSSGLLKPTIDEKQQSTDDRLDALMKALVEAKVVPNLMSAAGLQLGAAQARVDGQPRRPYVQIEVDSDGESVLVSAAKAVGASAKDEKSAPLLGNATPAKAAVRK